MSLTRVLANLRQMGWEPKHILDLGARTGDWTRECMKTYPEASYTLIDAIKFDNLKAFDRNPRVSCMYALVSDEVKECDWYELRNSGDSMYKEVTAHFKGVAPVRRTTTTLDRLFPVETMFDLIKIDCQGAELPILRGGRRLAQNADVIIMELPFMGRYNEGVATFAEHIAYMDSIGFAPFDISERHEAAGVLFQVDVVFLNKTHAVNAHAQSLINALGS